LGSLQFPPHVEAVAFLERGRGGFRQNRVLLADVLCFSFFTRSASPVLGCAQEDLTGCEFGSICGHWWCLALLIGVPCSLRGFCPMASHKTQPPSSIGASLPSSPPGEPVSGTWPVYELPQKNTLHTRQSQTQ